VIIWSAVAVIVAIAVATTVIIIAMQPHTYKIEFRAHWEDAGVGNASYSWGLNDDIQSKDAGCSGPCSTTKKLEFSENPLPLVATITVVEDSPSTDTTASKSVDCAIFQDGKQIAYQQGSGSVTCTAPVGKGAAN